MVLSEVEAQAHYKWEGLGEDDINNCQYLFDAYAFSIWFILLESPSPYPAKHSYESPTRGEGCNKW